MNKAKKSIIAQALTDVRLRHNITHEQWVEKSKVPISSINRFTSSSLTMPNFPYVCAMLKCLGESIDEFWDNIDKKIAKPADALKLDSVPVSIVGDIPIDTPETKAAVQERIIIQAEAMAEQRALLQEKDAEIELLNARLEMYERILEEKDRTIANLEDGNRRKLLALQAICSAQ